MCLNVIELTEAGVERTASLVAAFRVALRSYKGVASEPDVEAGREELREYLAKGFPMYAAEEAGEYAGYIVCRIDEPCVWVESIYVAEKYRRRGVASLLFGKAEALAAERGEETVFNYVHPNNEAMIAFLRSKGYTVLNMIEIRKPYAGEKLTTTIPVGENRFDY